MGFAWNPIPDGSAVRVNLEPNLSSRPLRHYRAYGLRLDSDIDLPWPASGRGGGPDVTIRLGEVPRTLVSPADEFGYWQAAPNAFLLSVDGIGRCLVSDGGRRIAVAPAGENGDAHICLLDSALAACLQMRGVLTLHASAVATAAGAVLFAGAAGVGKSSLAAALVDRGYSLLADEVAGIVPGGACPPRALGGFPQIRLWPQTTNGLDASWRNGAPVRPGIENRAVPARRFHGGKLALHTVCFLSLTDGEDVLVEPLARGSAFTGLLNSTYRARQLHGLGQTLSHFHAMTAVVRRAAAKRVVRPRVNCPPGALAARVAERLPPPA